MSFFEQRIQNVRNHMQEHNVKALFINHSTHVRYLSGFTGSDGAVLVTLKEAYFFSDRRYEEQSQNEVKHCHVHMIRRSYLDTIKELNLLEGVSRVGFEGQYLTVVAWQRLQRVFPDVEWMSVRGVLERLGAVKDSEEIEFLKKAVAITDEVFTVILSELKVGVSERMIATKISYLMKECGAEGDSYDPIVASGANSALPHAHPGKRILQEGDFIVMDFGALYGGYHADMTRTVVVGEPSDKHREIYDLVLKSQLAGIAAAKAGMTGAELDHVCRSILDDAGYGEQFCHSTGHGIGLEVHTHPPVSGGNTEPLLENYVITIEPGIYLPGWGGVRIEDDCWIQSESCLSLNHASKELISVG